MRKVAELSDLSTEILWFNTFLDRIGVGSQCLAVAASHGCTLCPCVGDRDSGAGGLGLAPHLPALGGKNLSFAAALRTRSIMSRSRRGWLDGRRAEEARESLAEQIMRMRTLGDHRYAIAGIEKLGQRDCDDADIVGSAPH